MATPNYEKEATPNYGWGPVLLSTAVCCAVCEAVLEAAPDHSRGSAAVRGRLVKAGREGGQYGFLLKTTTIQWVKTTHKHMVAMNPFYAMA